MHAPLVFGLTVCVVLVILFCFVASFAMRDNGRNDFDDSWSLRMLDCSVKRPLLRELMVTVTHVGGVPFLFGVTLTGAVLLWQRGGRHLAIAWCCVSAGGGALNTGLKLAFDRDRPPDEWRDPAADEETKSFPSGHSMGSMIGYGLVGYTATRRRSRLQRILIVAGIALLVPVIGFSRIYLRAHWFTDVVGGLLMGGAWLALCLGILEDWRRRREHHTPAHAPGSPS